MQQQVADAIAIGIRLSPELVGRERRDLFVNFVADFFVIGCERGGDERRKFRHGGFSLLQARKYISRSHTTTLACPNLAN